MILFLLAEPTISCGLKKICKDYLKKMRGMLTKGVCFLHDSARPHTALVTNAPLDQFGCDVLNHPLYSPDLLPSNYHPFTSFKGGI